MTKRRTSEFCVLPSGVDGGSGSESVSLAAIEVFVADYSVATDIWANAGVVDVYKRLLVS